MEPLNHIINLQRLLTEACQMFDKALKVNRAVIQQIVDLAFKNIDLWYQNNNLLSVWQSFNKNINTHLSEPFYSKVASQTKSINAHISGQPLFLKTKDVSHELCADSVKAIISLCDFPLNNFLSPVSPHLAPLACVSKTWNYHVNKLQTPHALAHIRLKEQETRLFEADCRTAEDAIYFAIDNQLEVVNLKGFIDLTEDLLEELFEGLPNLKHLAISTPNIERLPKQCSQLQTLNCVNCYSLTSLPDMPNLKSFDCNCLERITSLPDMPHLISLDCCSFTQLTHLPPMPHLRSLICYGCPNLIIEKSHLPAGCIIKGPLC